MDLTLERILDTMSIKGISSYKMEKYLNIPRGSFSNWKRGMGKLYYSHIDKIADKLEVSIDYLIRGEETNRLCLSDQEVEIINWFRKMNQKEQNDFLASLRKTIDE